MRQWQRVRDGEPLLGKRANQIAWRSRRNCSAKLEEFAVTGENLEEVYENREQIEVSKHYERMPKPGPWPCRSCRTGKIYVRRPEVAEKPSWPRLIQKRPLRPFPLSVEHALTRKVLLGVSRAASPLTRRRVLVRELVKAGAEVQVVMTPSAHDFVTPLTLATLSKRPVLT
jgi:hypothetical protein